MGMTGGAKQMGCHGSSDDDITALLFSLFKRYLMLLNLIYNKISCYFNSFEIQFSIFFDNLCIRAKENKKPKSSGLMIRMWSSDGR